MKKEESVGERVIYEVEGECGEQRKKKIFKRKDPKRQKRDNSRATDQNSKQMQAKTEKGMYFHVMYCDTQ